MASGFGRFNSSPSSVSSYNAAAITAVVSQSVNTSARTVTVTVTAYASYYRSSGGNWNVSNGTALWHTEHSDAYFNSIVGGSTSTVTYNIGVSSAKSQTISNGNYYTIPDGQVKAYGSHYAQVTSSKTYSYSTSGAAISGSWSSNLHIYITGWGWVNASVSGNFTTDAISSSGTAPSGGYIIYNDSTWNTATATTGVTNWGTGYSSDFRRVQSIMVLGSTPSDFATVTADNWTTKGRRVWDKATSLTSEQMAMVTGDEYLVLNSPMALKGMRHYMLAYWNYTNVGVTSGLDTTIRYLPPAPSFFSYTVSQTGPLKTYHVSFVGDTTSNNSTAYDTNALTRTIRYKIGNGQWVVVDQDTVAGVDLVSTFNVVLAPGKTAVVEGWMTYHGMQSEVSTIQLVNSDTMPIGIYGSVNNVSKKTIKWYGSVNTQSKKILKIYGSVGGVAREVFEDV